MQADDFCWDRPDARPVEDCGDHGADEGRVRLGEHLRQVGGHLPGGEAYPVQRRVLGQRTQRRQQAVDLRRMDGAAEKVEPGNPPKLGDLARDHAPARAAHQDVPVANAGGPDHGLGQFGKRGISPVGHPVQRAEVRQLVSGLQVHAVIGAQSRWGVDDGGVAHGEFTDAGNR